MPVFAPVMTATFPRAAVARVATPTREVVVDDVDACARECIANARRRRRRRVKPCHSNQINQSARPFTVSEKTRLGNGDDDDDDDSKRHFCVYMFVCVYSMNLYTYRYVCGTDRDGPGRTRGAAERDGRRRRRDRARDDGLRKNSSSVWFEAGRRRARFRRLR